jgi:hypothetical protein
MRRDFDRDKRFRGDDKKSIDSKEDFLDKYEAELARKKKEAEDEAAAKGLSLEHMRALKEFGTLDTLKIHALRFGAPMEKQLIGSCTPMSVAQVERDVPVFWDDSETSLIAGMARHIRDRQLARAQAFEAAGLVKPGQVTDVPLRTQAASQTPEATNAARAALTASAAPGLSQFDRAKASLLALEGNRAVSEQPKASATSSPRKTRPLNFQQIRVQASAAAVVQLKESGALSATASATSIRQTAAQGITGGGHKVPFADILQPAFGPYLNLDLVRAHTDSSAAASASAIGAKAFATGKNIVFAGSPDLHTVAHELAHVVQQSMGQAPTGGVGSVGDDYERQADAIADRVVAGQSIADLMPAGADAMSADIKTDAVQMKEASSAPVPSAAKPKMAAASQATKPGQKSYVSCIIAIPENMTQEQFQQAVMKQVFGGPVTGLIWSDMQSQYLRAAGPVVVMIETHLFAEHRAAVNRARGLEVGDDGRVAGASARQTSTMAGTSADDKADLQREVQRRLQSAVGRSRPTRDEQDSRDALKASITDEVLAEREYLQNLPDKVKQVMHASIGAKVMTARDYQDLFATAKKIEGMSAAQVTDYLSKVTGSTMNVGQFASNIDRYLARAATSDKQSADLDTTKTKLIGLEGLYAQYRNVGNAGPSGALALMPMLKANHFSSGYEFQAYIDRFLHGFESGAVNIAADALDKYAGRLHRESQRYQDAAVTTALHGKLQAFRQQHKSVAHQQHVIAEVSKQPTVKDPIGPSRQSATAEAQLGLNSAKAIARSQLQALAAEYPVFSEEGLPENKQISLSALAAATETSLGSLLRSHIATRIEDLKDAKIEIMHKPASIYKLDTMMPMFYQHLGVEPGSVFEQIIIDKMHSSLVAKIVKGIALGLVAIALTVVSLGTATPAIIAAGAAVAGGGLSTYMALEEYEQYVTDKKLAAVGLADDPSIGWLVVSVVGAAVDMASAVSAVHALAPAAKALNAATEAGDISNQLVKFNQVVADLKRRELLTDAVKAAADKAADARAGFLTASKNLLKSTTGKMYSGIGGIVSDGEALKALKELAQAGYGTVFHTIDQFLTSIKLARTEAKLGELSTEELNAIKQVWEETKAAEASARRSKRASRIKPWKLRALPIRQHWPMARAPRLPIRQRMTPQRKWPSSWRLQRVSRRRRKLRRPRLPTAKQSVPMWILQRPSRLASLPTTRLDKMPSAWRQHYTEKRRSSFSIPWEMKSQPGAQRRSKSRSTAHRRKR